jgi:hypothetical protein
LETKPPEKEDSPAGTPSEDASTESLLEALLVDDADIQWDKATGKPTVTRRSKTELDSTPDTA